MRAIIVDDEPLMLRRFVRLSEGIEDLQIAEQFQSAEAALRYAENHSERDPQRVRRRALPELTHRYKPIKKRAAF